jgi:hypothetical protein
MVAASRQSGGVVAEERSTDAVEAELVALERLVSRIRARQCELVEELERRAVVAIDGARTMVDWIAAKLDVGHDLARSLVSGARALAGFDDLKRVLADGTASFDRIRLVASYADPGSGAAALEASYRYDLAGLTRLAARRRRITRHREREAARDRYLVIQPDLFDCTWKLWGRLTATEGSLVESTLRERADALPDFPGGPEPLPQRMASALVGLCQDSGAADGGPTLPEVTVFVDAELAARTRAEAGGYVVSGPRVGPSTLEELLCGSRVGVLEHRSEGSLIRIGDHRQTIPAAVRRFIYHRDAGVCSISGCTSRYRLQPHHLTPRSRGGANHPENLALVCWYHHHRVIHQLGFRIDPESPPNARRLVPPDDRPPP